jgi:hypothetical protein
MGFDGRQWAILEITGRERVFPTDTGSSSNADPEQPQKSRSTGSNDAAQTPSQPATAEVLF